MPAVKRSDWDRLTPEQQERFGLPTDELLKDHWNEIPEVITPAKAQASTSISWWDEAVKSITDFFGNASNSLWNSFKGFGSDVKDTLVSLIFIVVLLIVLNFLVRGIFARWTAKRKNRDNDSCHNSCNSLNDMASYQRSTKPINSCSKSSKYVEESRRF